VRPRHRVRVQGRDLEGDRPEAHQHGSPRRGQIFSMYSWSSRRRSEARSSQYESAPQRTRVTLRSLLVASRR
jgi:hypothetical protein